MEQLYAMEYLEEELEKTKQKLEKDKHMFGKLKKKVEDSKNKINIIKEKIDDTYETFSPISVKYEVAKDELRELQKELLNLQTQQDTKECEVKESEKRVNKIIEALEDLKNTNKREEKMSESKKLLSKEAADRVYGLKILEQQELERQRIARELHDTTVQNLTALIHKIEFITQIMDMDSIRAKLELQVMNGVLREAINDMREVIYNLRPMTYDDIGFSDTLYRAIERLQNGCDIKINFKIKGEPYEMDSVVQLTILRIIQEATSNCKKYSQAKNLYINFTYKENEIELNIKDDGIGFDINTVKTEVRKDNSGFGISMMRERVYLLSGVININSGKEGTEIEVILPKLGLTWSKMEESYNGDKNINS